MKKLLLITVSLLIVAGCVAAYDTVDQAVLGAKIKPELKLKSTKDKVLYRGEVDEYNCGEELIRTNCDLKGTMMKYSYVSDVEMPAQKFQGLDEDVSKRTGNTLIFDKGNGQTLGKFYSGNVETMHKDTDNKWKVIEHATTTVDAFNDQMKITLLDRIIGREVIAADFPTGVGDGIIADNNSATWSTAHNRTTGASPYTIYGGLGCVLDGIGGKWYFERSLWPTDTSAIDAGATIDTAALLIYANAPNGSGNTATSTWVVQTDQPEESNVVGDDFDNTGMNKTPPDEGSDRQQVEAAGWVTYTLNATGKSWVKTDGDSPNCGDADGFTCLGVGVAMDITDFDPGSDDWCNPARTSEYSGTDTDPYMTITWTAVPQDTCTYGGSGDWVVESDDNCYVTADTYVTGILMLLNRGEGSLSVIDGAVLAVQEIQSTSTNINFENGSKLKFWTAQ